MSVNPSNHENKSAKSPECPLASLKYPTAIIGKRNSRSKTDHDAAFMRMKEDHMRNGQLMPGYTVQVGTERQFTYRLQSAPAPTDTRCLIPHLEQVKSQLGQLPGTIIAEAGYGGEEGYALSPRRGGEV